MSDTGRQRVSIEVPWGTVFKVLAAFALVWLWLQLVDIVLLLVVAVLLAVTLTPLVGWLERRRLSRSWAVTVVTVGFLLLVGGFVLLTWSSLSVQGQYLIEHLDTVQARAMSKLPAWMRRSIGASGSRGGGVGDGVASALGSYGLLLAQSVTSALTVAILGFILTIYLLLEGRATRDWLVAFVPHRHRPKVQRTLDEGQRVILGYVTGNAITSVIAATTTLLALSALKVPSALLLAIIAGLADFVPVIGFPLAAVPALLLAFSVSPNTGLVAFLFYIAYHTVENYLLSPWAYGDRMKLSNVAVILSFVVGAEVAGVIGALIALPIAALYPPIERIWLREKLGNEVVEEHKAIQNAQ